MERINYFIIIIFFILILIEQCPGFKLDSEGKPDHSVTVDYAEEARYFVESRLLQRNVKIVLESVNNTNFVGSILYPKGNIAEALLREGFAKCVDWSMAFMRSGKITLFLFKLIKEIIVRNQHYSCNEIFFIILKELFTI